MAIEDIARQLGNGLGETLAVHPSDAPHVRYASVDTVNTDGTLDVTIDGTTLRGVCATTGCVGADEGMRCVVLRQGPLATVIGLVANTNLADVYLQNAHVIWGRDTGGNARHVLQVTNDYNNVVLGYGGYEASQGATNIYGNEVKIISRDVVKVNGRYLSKGDVSVGHWTNSSAVTTTSSVTIGSFTHTSYTGRVLIIADMMLQTSRYTSSIQIYADSTYVSHARTNLTSWPARMVDIRAYEPARGTAITYSLRMNSQDSGTTATFPGYSTAELIVIDIS